MKPTLAALVLIATLATGCAGIGTGKQIDSTVLAEIDQGNQEIPIMIVLLPAAPLKSVDEEMSNGGTGLNETSQAVSIQHEQQFKVNQEKFIADAAKIKGLRIVSSSREGMVYAVGTPDAIRKAATLPYVGGIVSNRPVQVHPG
jgi:hypothetical protein